MVLFCSVFVSHSINDIDDINDKNVFVNHFVNDFANHFENKRTKSIENKSVVLSGVYLQPFWGYLYPFCSTFFTFFTLQNITLS